MLFFFIRHGDPIYDPDSLTPLGHRQAEAAARRLAQYGLDTIFSSTSTRAYQTALPTAEVLKKPITQLDWANESHAWMQLAVVNEKGQRKWMFEDEDSRRLLRSPEIRAMDRSWYEHPAFAGTACKEGILRIQREADAFFASLGYRHAAEESGFVAENPTDERVALFAHQGFGLAFLSCVLDVPYPMLCTRFDMSHSHFTVIEFAGQKGDIVIPRVLTLSNDSHLFRDGIPTRYQNRLYF